MSRGEAHERGEMPVVTWSAQRKAESKPRLLLLTFAVFGQSRSLYFLQSDVGISLNTSNPVGRCIPAN